MDVRFIWVNITILLMDNKKLNQYIAMMLVAIGKTGQPNSYVWLAVDPQMEDLDLYRTVLGVLVKGEVVKVSNHFITLTEKGAAAHDRIVAILASTPSTPEC